METWRPILEFPDYEVSDHGRVRSYKPYRNYAPVGEPHILRARYDKDGYAVVVLRVGSTRKDCRVAALVCAAWHGERPEGMLVRHLDGCNTNDVPNNLLWGTPQENSADAVEHGTVRRGSSVNTSRLTESDVRMIRESELSHSELARQLGVTAGAIWHIRAGRTWKHLED